MKIFIIIFLYLYNLSFGQSIADLDLKYGFKQFKFGITTKQVSNIIKNKDQWDKNPNISEYIYTGTDLKYLYDVKVKEISLTFYKNKLYSIIISFGSPFIEYTNSEYNLVQYSLEKTFGTVWNSPSNETGQIIKGSIWSGNKVTLEHLMLNFSKENGGNQKVGYVHLYENSIQKLRLKDEF